MAGRVYYINHFFSAKATAGDLIGIESASTKVTKIISIRAEQSSDYGDAAAEGLRLNVSRGTAGSGGTSKTPRPVNPGDAAFAGTCRAADTSAMTSPVVQIEGGMNIQAGWLWTPTEKEELILAPSAAIALQLVTTPADAIDFEVTIGIEELG